MVENAIAPQELSTFKVLLFAYACTPDSGSEAGCGWNWVWHLAQVGHDVWVLTDLGNKGVIERVLESRPISNLHFVYIEVPPWIKRLTKARFMALYGYYAHYLGWQKQAYKKALVLDREHQFDVVHHVTWSGINTGSWLCYLNKPFIFGPVGGGQTAPSAFKKYFLKNWKLEIVRSLLVNSIRFNGFVAKTIRQADLVLATNSDTLHLTRKLGARRVEMFLDNALPDDYLPSELPRRSCSQELQLLWVGGIYPRKGLRLALESLTFVSDSIPIKMTILGDGFLAHCVPDWIKEFGLESRVVYRGRVSWTELKTEYLKSDVLLFTSLRDSFGTQLLEAMAHALPVIVLDHQGARDFIPNRAGIKVPVNSPTATIQALAQAIEYMSKHPEDRWKMGRVGYEFVKTQTWSQKAIKMSEYYQQIVRNNSAKRAETSY